MEQLATLSGGIKHYDWGGNQYIPSLLQIENPNLHPFAEYWLGVHPQANCVLMQDDGSEVLLRDFVAKKPEKALGKEVFKAFGGLPYLLKVLDVKDMLSIQVHPSKKMAAIDFEAENQKGVPLTAVNRNYKDANHKPELMVAMSPFYLLHGFKPEAELINVLKRNSELKMFLPVFKKEGYKGLYKLVMEMPQEEVNEILQPLVNRIIPLYQQNRLDKTGEDFWAARAALTFVQPGVLDRGIFSVYFFNLVQLETGEAIFQNAGVPHAYLEGHNVEIMASSDNVLRGGLTTKHIDTVELLKHTRCEATLPKIIRNVKSKPHRLYKAPVKDFELQSWHIKKDGTVTVDIKTAEILLLMEGRAELRSKKKRLTLQAGSITAVAFSGAKVLIKALEDTWIFKAGTPLG